MKNIFFAIAAFVTVCIAQTPAKAITFQRAPLSLISFQAGNNAKVIIRNSEGKIVRSKNSYSNACNIESSSLQPGNYSYIIISGNTSYEGSFSVK